MVTLVSAVLWLVLLAGALGSFTLLSRKQEKGLRLAMTLLLTAGALLYFRPHEEVLTGSDAGAYFNAAAFFLHHDALFANDELLEQVPLETREAFYFGHKYYRTTKDNALSFPDPHTPVAGPRFQPAFSILMTLPGKLISPYAMFYVTPLLCLFNALALGYLTAIFMGSSKHAWTAMFIYLTIPLVIWQGRTPRPEFAASLCLLAGFTQLLRVWLNESRFPAAGVLLGALLLALAPFFHITAWGALIPACLFLAIGCLRGRSMFLIVPPVMLGSVILFIYQCLHITDHYGLSPYLKILLQHAPLILTGVGLLYGLLVFISVKKPLDCAACSRKRRVTWALGIAQVAVLLLTLFIFFTGTPPAERVFTGHEYHYLHPTDLRIAVMYLSAPLCIAGLIGLLMMLGRKQLVSRGSLFFVLMLLPAAFTIGNIYDFFLSRLLVIAFIPALALGAAVLVSSLPRKIPGFVSYALLAALCLLPWLERSPWIAVTQRTGLYTSLERIADTIRRDSDAPILLGEYSGLVSPIHYVFNIPALYFDNYSRRDYGPALDAWANIMRTHPDRTSFFLTPFQPPVDERFTFRHVQSVRESYPTLRDERFKRPRHIKPTNLELDLYEMSRAANTEPPASFVRGLDLSNMGLKNFYDLRNKTWDCEGIRVSPGQPWKFPAELTGRDAALFSYAPDSESRPAISTPSARHLDLGGGWHLHLFEQLPEDAEWSVHTTRYLHSLYLLGTPHERIELRSPGETVQPFQAEFAARWSPPASKVYVPLKPDTPPSRPYLGFALVKAPEESGERVTLSMHNEETGGPGSQADLNAEQWTWIVFDAYRPWIQIEAAPSWNIGHKKYPEGLGFLLGKYGYIKRD